MICLGACWRTGCRKQIFFAAGDSSSLEPLSHYLFDRGRGLGSVRLVAFSAPADVAVYKTRISHTMGIRLSAPMN
jgi:hypothetical protein